MVSWPVITCSAGADVGIVWQRLYGGTGSEKATSVCNGRNGVLYAAGWTNSTDGDVQGARSSYDLWVAKFNANGDVIWKVTRGGSADDGAEDVIETADGGVLVVGSTNSSDGDVGPTRGNADLWVIRLDSSGKVLWQKTLGGSSSEYAKSVTETSDHSIVIVGVTGSSDGDVDLSLGQSDAWIVKLDSVGTLQWQTTRGGDLNDFAYSVLETRDGSYVVAGELGARQLGWVQSDAWILKFGQDGRLLWQKTFGSSSHADWLESVVESVDGGLIACGRVPPANEPGSGAAVIKLDSVGNVQWVSFMERTNCAAALDVALSPNGMLLVSGLAINPVNNITKRGNEDIVLVCLAEGTGKYLWQKVIGGTATDNGLDVQWTVDSGFVVAGYTASSDGDVVASKGNGDAWIVKLRNNPTAGLFDAAPIAQLRAYPNPASSRLTVEFPCDFPFNGPLQVMSVDALGRLNALACVPAPSVQSLLVDVSELAAGSHILHVSDGTRAFLVRCVIVR
ncbi:MAG: hypothetical protein FGM32_05000 [Candidatus Kapabacteria bacterium]|nr:hypothetical protein [Candidatus Kapabacteria bacterium]